MIRSKPLPAPLRNSLRKHLRCTAGLKIGIQRGSVRLFGWGNILYRSLNLLLYQNSTWWA
ncbi:Right origin-binding protein [Yersinia rohdei ATCC 43380]|nr:Right origin-binding protein [Yersinia rohdei ATCC 43380]